MDAELPRRRRFWAVVASLSLGWEQKMGVLIPSTGNQVKHLMDIFNICCEIASDRTVALVEPPGHCRVIDGCGCCSCHPCRALLHRKPVF